MQSGVNDRTPLKEGLLPLTYQPWVRTFNLGHLCSFSSHQLPLRNNWDGTVGGWVDGKESAEDAVLPLWSVPWSPQEKWFCESLWSAAVTKFPAYCTLPAGLWWQKRKQWDKAWSHLNCPQTLVRGVWWSIARNFGLVLCISTRLWRKTWKWDWTHTLFLVLDLAMQSVSGLKLQ